MSSVEVDRRDPKTFGDRRGTADVGERIAALVKAPDPFDDSVLRQHLPRRDEKTVEFLIGLDEGDQIVGRPAGDAWKIGGVHVVHRDLVGLDDRIFLQEDRR